MLLKPAICTIVKMCLRMKITILDIHSGSEAERLATHLLRFESGRIRTLTSEDPEE